MIKYNLLCDSDHEFEGWFRSSDDYDAQARDGLLECPVCASSSVRKALMAPAIARGGSSRSDARLAEIKANMGEAMDRARRFVEKNFDYVGDRFPEEARRIHYGETEKRGIYGEATGDEVRDLVDEGVSVAPVPGAPQKDAQGEPQIADGKKKLN
ncbi:MAG: DUF1178 family protein [Pseudomonadota bacterium]